MLKVALISKWHVHARDYAHELSSTPGCEIAGVWDEDAAVCKAWAEELGCRAYESYEAVLTDPQIGGVSITTSTNLHPDIIIRACDAGKAVFTEKVLALRTEDALRIQEAVRRNGTRFVISFPHKCNPSILRAKQMADAGELGEVTYARVRNVHNGSTADWLPPHFYDRTLCGGGAMIDLGAHPMYTLCWLLGEPLSVQSTFTSFTNRPVEDNAVSVLTFPKGVIGVSETGFVSQNNPYTLEISGTKGALMVHGTLQACCEATGGEWKEITDLPEKPELPVRQWVKAVNEGYDLPEFGIEQAVLLTRVMEAAYQPEAAQGASL